MMRSDEAKSRTRVRKRRAEVVDAAARVFSERGYHGASTQDIADRLGMRQASLYYYFASKEAALEEVCTIGTEGAVDRARAVVAASLPVEERLRTLMIAQLAPTRDRADHVRTFLKERKWLPRESRLRIDRVMALVEQSFEALIAEGVESGRFRAGLDTRRTARALVGMMNAAAMWPDHELAPFDEVAGALADLGVQAVLADDS